MKFDQPWEGIHCGYCTMIQDGPRFRVYYRGMPADVKDGTAGEVTCVADSDDGIHWTKPTLGLFEAARHQKQQRRAGWRPATIAQLQPADRHAPRLPARRALKALAGLDKSGLVAFVSADGLRWTRLRSEPVIPRSPLQIQLDVRFAKCSVLVRVGAEICLLLPNLRRRPPHRPL